MLRQAVTKAPRTELSGTGPVLGKRSTVAWCETSTQQSRNSIRRPPRRDGRCPKAGIRLAIDLGFRVRVAATLGPDAGDAEHELIALFDELGLDESQRVIRRTPGRVWPTPVSWCPENRCCPRCA